MTNLHLKIYHQKKSFAFHPDHRHRNMAIWVKNQQNNTFRKFVILELLETQEDDQKSFWKKLYDFFL